MESYLNPLILPIFSFSVSVISNFFLLLNCPLITAESTRFVLQASGGGRSQEPASLEKQMISTSSWVTLSSPPWVPQSGVSDVPLGNATMNVGPFQLSGQDSDQETKAGLFSVLWLGGLASLTKPTPSWTFALHPPGCGCGAVCKKGLDEKWHILVFLQLFPSKPMKTRAHIWVTMGKSDRSTSQSWTLRQLQGLQSISAWRKDATFLFKICETLSPDISNPNQIRTFLKNWEHKENPCPLLSTFGYGISKSPLIWEFRLGCRSPHKWLFAGVAFYSLP